MDSGSSKSPAVSGARKCVPYPHIKIGAECVFFCVYNPMHSHGWFVHTTFVCRGAVGHRIGGLVPQKPAGSYLQMIF